VEPAQPRDGESTSAGGTAIGRRLVHDMAGEITVGTLGATFPQWRIFGACGLWWATRDGLVSLDGPKSLLRRLISAPDLTALAEKLCLQEYLDRLDPQELAAVYRDVALPLLGVAG
jgi:hypothetical protein